MALISRLFEKFVDCIENRQGSYGDDVTLVNACYDQYSLGMIKESFDYDILPLEANGNAKSFIVGFSAILARCYNTFA